MRALAAIMNIQHFDLLSSLAGKHVKRIYTDNMYCELDESRISSKYSVRGR